MKRFLATLALLVLSAAAFALPSVEAVQKEVQQGHYAQAESMMHEVVAAKPNSAKAHYIYAEILAHNGRFDQAAQEARLARQIDPQIAFTQPDKFRAFEQSLQREQATAKSQATQATQAAPPRVVSPRTKETFVLLRVEEYERLKEEEYDDSPWTREELQALAWERVKHEDWDEYDNLPEKP